MNQLEAEIRAISLTINGEVFDRSVETRRTLADFLRHDLNLTGTHLGCEHGVCGACTILLEGKSVRSCLLLAVQADGSQVRTVEGLGRDGQLHPLQTAFWSNHGLQCGFCTPGILMSLVELFDSTRPVNENTVRDVLSGHICRCTGYQNIVKAALDAAEKIRSAESS